MPKYELVVGVQKQPVKAVFYGPEGIGKSTAGAQMPDPVFIDIEGGTNQLPVARMPRPTSWAMLLDEIRAVRDGKIPGCATLVIDTVDAAEALCKEHVITKNEWENIESPGFNKGFVVLAGEFGKMLDALSEVVEHGRNVVLLGHSIIGNVTRPDESMYTIFTMNLTDRKSASTNSMVKAWSDMLLFFDWKVYVETDKQGKGHASGGKRVMYTTHRVSWDAKNRFGLPDQMPLDDASIQRIASLMVSGHPGDNARQTDPRPEPATKPTPSSNAPRNMPHTTTPQRAPQSGSGNKKMQEVEERIARMDAELEQERSKQKPEPKPSTDVRDTYPARMKPLADLMKANGIEDDDLRRAMAEKGYVTYETPVEKYRQRLVEGVVDSWDNFVKFVQQIKDGPTPF